MIIDLNLHSNFILVNPNDILLTASKEIMYHGTAFSNLRSILKKGLFYNKNNRVWDGQEREDLESYPGVYLTNNLITATSSSGEANRKINKPYDSKLIIIAQIETKSPLVFLDEDLLHLSWGIKNIDHPYTLIAYALKPEELIDFKESFELFWKRLVHDFRSGHRTNIYFKIPNKAKKILFFYYRTTLISFLKYKALKEEGDSSYSYDLNSMYKQLKSQISFEQARTEYRKNTELLLKKLNWAATLPISQRRDDIESFKQHHVRVNSPITFKGKNRILAIVSVPFDYKDKMISLHYGNLSSPEIMAFLKDVEERIGSGYEITKV